MRYEGDGLDQVRTGPAIVPSELWYTTGTRFVMEISGTVVDKKVWNNLSQYVLHFKLIEIQHFDRKRRIGGTVMKNATGF